MNYKRILKKTASFLRKNIINILFINLFIGYSILLIAFLMVIIHPTLASNSDWVTENFPMTFEPDSKECKFINGFYAKLISQQEPLGKEFENVINKNLWDLYEN